MILPELKIQLPNWIERFLAETGYFHSKIEERMRLTVEPSSRNTNKKTIKLKTFTY